MANSQVSEKNTKSEILQAYRELVKLAKEAPTVKPAGTFRDQILSLTEKIETEIAGRSSEVEQLERQIEELKKKLDLGEKFEFNLEKLAELEEEIRQKQQGWQRQHEQLKHELAQEGEWARKRLEKELEQRRWEFEVELKQKERKLAEQRTEFEQEAQDYKDLKKQIAASAQKLEKEKEGVVREVEKKLQAEFEDEKKYLQQGFESEKGLLEQKIENQEARLADQKVEIASLQKQLSVATQQIKQLAVAALQGEPFQRESPGLKQG